MERKLERQHAIARERLSGERYVEDLLREGEATGLLTAEDTQQIRLRILELLALRCASFQQGSSSIREEAAAHILESTLFTLGAACKAYPNADAAALALKTEEPSALFRRGRAAVLSSLRRTRQLWLLVQGTRIETENMAYNDTFSEGGIGVFFRKYELEYSAQEIPGSIDYPLFVPVRQMAGVDFMREYLGNALCENHFCAHFPAPAIQRVLRAHDKRCDTLLVNIFGLVLQTALACVLTGQSPRALALRPEDHAALCAMGVEGGAVPLGRAVQPLLEELGCRGAVAEYVRAALPAASRELRFLLWAKPGMGHT